ncbi:ornithine cyclodeaminase family protein [Nocardioides sp. KR10-350]|uniref:ornithine cyclodeaminase family protein n=1 Tax=Nocardioides cheoyonin TaxID=3156615 RepID=UPI0032B4DDE9
MTVILDQALVPGLISMPEAIDALESAYRSLARGRAVEAERSNLVLPNGWLRTMSAALLDEGIAGYKEFHRFRGVSRYAYHLFDLETGEQLAVMDGRHLTALRTGACGGLAAREMAPESAPVVGVIGSGLEARAQVDALVAVRDVRRIQVFSPTPRRREEFCAHVADSTKGAVSAVPIDAAEQAVEGADVLIVATNTAGRGPAMSGLWLTGGRLHINSVGSTLPDQRELDEDVWPRVDRVVIDSPDVLVESGDVIAARAAGTFDPERVVPLGDVLIGDVLIGEVGSRAATGVTLYKSVGSAVQDIAIAARIYRRAISAGLDLPEVAPFQSVRTVAVPPAQMAVR